ncbi:unnamed protein product [Owenia fusiformis]|uniref:Uncharacterized protein n=1 Tax=Owenia fusiformis TaxID=6347 RepID=A0A8J1TGP1_OWEFU|nr:unnamed protein product [Owenia fusiformis]
MATSAQPFSGKCCLLESHFCKLPSQSNVYGLAKVFMPSGMNKILVASLCGKVISMEYQKTRPSSQEIHFTYIPGDAQVVSIDAFNKSFQSNGVVVGITFIKEGPDGKPVPFINIYSDWEQGSEYNLASIAQGCFSLELPCIPYYLSHAQLFMQGSIETVFLLSGSDNQVHLFREDKFQHMFFKEDTLHLFPEFESTPSPILWFNMRYFDEHKRRLAAYGCQNGFLKVTLVNTETMKVLNEWTAQHDTPVTSVKLFTLQTEAEYPSFLASSADSVCSVDDSESESNIVPEYHLVVTSALEVSVVYRHILERGLYDQLVLPESDKYDCVLSTCVADVDFDGNNEILLATYGHKLLAYKFISRKLKLGQSSGHHSNQPSDPSVLHAHTQKHKPSLTDGDYKMIWQRSFADPLLAVEQVDLLGDGMLELAVLSLRGLHILQHDLDEAGELCERRLRELTRTLPELDAFQQLQSENLMESTQTQSSDSA